MPVRTRTLAAYALLGISWIGLAHGLMPSWLASAYQGQRVPVISALFRMREPHPFAHYLDAWNSFSGAVILALFLHLALVVILGRIDRRLDLERTLGDHERRANTRANLIFGLFGVAYLAVTIGGRVRHDYGAHLLIWHVILGGGDPWWIGQGATPNSVLNTYGPLFNPMALLVSINPLAPKLLFAWSYVVFVIWLLKDLGGRLGRVGVPAFAVAAWIVNPFPLIDIAYFGHFDVLVGLACASAMYYRDRSRDIASGVCIAAGVLLKFLPLVVLPFLALDRRRLRLRLLLSATLAILAGAAASVLIWGMATFRPFTNGSAYAPQLLSIFRFLRGTWSPLRWMSPAANADFLWLPSLAIAGLAVFVWVWLRSVRPSTGAVLAVLTTLLFYKVGFEQYQLVLFIVASYWYCTSPEGWGGRDRVLNTAMAAYLGWLAAFDVFYASIGDWFAPNGPWRWVDELVGLPTFLLGCVLFVAIVRTTRANATGRRLQQSLA